MCSCQGILDTTAGVTVVVGAGGVVIIGAGVVTGAGICVTGTGVVTIGCGVTGDGAGDTVGDGACTTGIPVSVEVGTTAGVGATTEGGREIGDITALVPLAHCPAALAVD